MHTVFGGDTNFWWREMVKYSEGVEGNTEIPGGHGGDASLGNPPLQTVTI